MKKRLLALLLATMLLLMAGCGTLTIVNEETGGQKESDEQQSPADESEETAPPVVYPTTDDPPEAPLGTGIGVNPGRVSWAYNDEAFLWDGNGYWWLEKNFNSEVVKTMIVDLLCSLAGEDDVDEALTALFTDFNKRVYGKSEGYQKGQKIAIKTNMNVTGNGAASNNKTTGYFPTPVTTRAILEVLVAHGVAPSDITLYDGTRMIPTYLQEMCSEGALKGVNFEYYDNTANGVNDVVADTTKPIRWSIDFTAAEEYLDCDGYPTYNTSYYPKCVTEATYMINLFNLRGHNLAGFTASAKNHFGTIMPGYHKNGNITFPAHYRSGAPTYAGLHRWVSTDDFYMNPPEIWDLPKREMGSYTCLVDLMSNIDAGGKTFLYISDGLAATPMQGSNLSIEHKWYSAPFGDGTKEGSGWTNSLFMSQDPVAIDSVMLDFILAEREAAGAAGYNQWYSDVLPEGHTAENYLIEAALADNPPSGVAYQDGYGNPVKSLGVFQHWNNPTEKYYSRNLGEDEGIELVKIEY